MKVHIGEPTADQENYLKALDRSVGTYDPHVMVRGPSAPSYAPIPPADSPAANIDAPTPWCIRHGYTPEKEIRDEKGRMLFYYKAAHPNRPWIKAMAPWNVLIDPRA